VRSQWLKVAVILGWFAWTAVIIPGHTRGCISLSSCGLGCGDEIAAERCCTRRGPPSEDHNPKQPPANAVRNCAVCFLAAYLTHSPPPSVVPGPSGFVRAVAPPPAATADVPSPRGAHLIRGPPVRA